MPRTPLALSLVMTILTIAQAATASADTGAVEIHGYGGWTYSRSDSDDNRYLTSSQDGESDYVNLAVALSSRASDRARINAQVWWEARSDEEVRATIDFAFGEWRVSDALRLRMGQVKHPYGIYTEVFDVGTIRPFFWLPQSVYGPSGAVAESYRGVGITGSVFAPGSWRFEYDLYGGEMGLETPNFAAVFAAGGNADVKVTSTKSMIGQTGAPAGPFDLVAALMAFRDGCVPETLNCDNPDPDCPVNVVRGGKIEMSVRQVLLVSVSVGGQCAAMVVRKV